jgi:hypothetical protein
MSQESRPEPFPARSSESTTKPALTTRPSARWAALSQSERARAAAALGGVFAVAALAFWWTEAPLYNLSGSIDPWLYTALFVNFENVYEPFANTYYGARLPWIVPGRLLYTTLPVDVAYWLLHGLSFVGGVTALFVLARRHVGLTAAVVGAASLALNPLYWNAQRWDYVDGVTITYLLAGLCFGLPLATGRRRIASLVTAGVFFAAAATTNLFVVLVVALYPLLYVFLQPASGLRRRTLLFLQDAAAALVGAVALVVTLGLYARSNGGPFLYFEPQVDFAREGVGETYKRAGYEWLLEEPRLLVPVFLIAVAAVLLALGRSLPPARFAAGSVVGLTFLTAVTYGWEFLAGGSLLEYTYYFSYLLIPMALTITSIAALAASLARSQRWTGLTAAAIATLGAVVALGLIFSSERSGWTGRTGAVITLAAMAVTAALVLAAVLTRRERRGTLVAVVAIGAVVFSSQFAFASSKQLFLEARSAPSNRNLYRAALEHVDFVNGFSSPGGPLPTFWYRGTNKDFTSIQSMYFYGYTGLSLEFPRLTDGLREQLDTRKPQTIVLLCDLRDCLRGVAALGRAGYPYARERAERISHGSIDLWAVRMERTPGA